MKLNQIFTGGFLKAEDLQGRTVRVTISKVEVKEFDDGNKIIIHFQGKDKSLVVNKTNANIIAHVTGCSDTNDWSGQTIQLTVKKVEFKGDLVDAIRVVLEDRPAPAPVAAQAPQPTAAPTPIPAGTPPVDDVPF